MRKWQKRPTYMAKETYRMRKRQKRPLLVWQKRPTYMAKESYLHGKRDLQDAFKHTAGLWGMCGVDQGFGVCVE